MHALLDWPHLGQISTYHFEFSRQPRDLKLGGGRLKVPLCRSLVTPFAAEQAPRDLRACCL